MNVFKHVDYKKQSRQRKKLGNYLRTGSFKSLQTNVRHSRSALRVRVTMYVIAGIIFCIGMTYVIW